VSRPWRKYPGRRWGEAWAVRPVAEQTQEDAWISAFGAGAGGTGGAVGAWGTGPATAATASGVGFSVAWPWLVVRLLFVLQPRLGPSSASPALEASSPPRTSRGRWPPARMRKRTKLKAFWAHGSDQRSVGRVRGRGDSFILANRTPRDEESALTMSGFLVIRHTRQILTREFVRRSRLSMSHLGLRRKNDVWFQRRWQWRQSAGCATACPLWDKQCPARAVIRLL